MSLSFENPTQAPCPCGSEATYRHCCGPLHWGLNHAQTAEQLMRSRFSAAFYDISDYLITSLHPSKRPWQESPSSPPADQPSVPPTTRWLHLRIVDIQEGSADETEGIVEFVATYRRGKALGQLHERSQFIQEKDRWFYLEGELEDRLLPTPGRNASCWCGSGKKQKKCHGR